MTLKKIDGSFTTKVQNLNLQTISHTGVNDPAFKVTLFQVANANGEQKAVEIVMSEQGKALSYNVLAAEESAVVPTWPDKDALTLAEAPFHHLEHMAATHPELVPYLNNFSNFVLTQSTLNGEVVAVVDISATGESKILRGVVKTNGELVSLDIVP